jgi:hypothetical protein
MYNKQTFTTCCFVILIAVLPYSATAQWVYRGSYIIRNSNPNHGFGLDLERHNITNTPYLYLGFRIQAKFLDQNKNITDLYGSQYTTDNQQIIRNYKSFQFGLSGIIETNMTFLSPYAGMGFSIQNMNIEDRGIRSLTLNPQKMYMSPLLNIYGGINLNIIPFLHPFVEFNFSKIFEKSGYNFPGLKKLNKNRHAFIIGLSITSLKLL